MAFPVNPTNGNIATVNGITYAYNSTKGAWLRASTTGANLTANSLTLTSNNQSISSSSGALVVTGGAGIGGDLWVGGVIRAVINGTLTANIGIDNTVIGGNIPAAGTFTNLTATNVTATNITAVSNLTVSSGNINLTGSIQQNGVVGGIIPIGGIIMWSGNIASIPTNWSLCNGINGTPDLRDKFIIGASADSGGQANTTITGSTTKSGGTKDANTVTHTHTITDPGHFHNTRGSRQVQAGGDNSGPFVTESDWAASDYQYKTSANVTGITIDSAGSSGTNQNLPPYYALAFIMRVS